MDSGEAQDKRWAERPVLAFLVGVVMVGLPILGGLVASLVLAGALPRPDGIVESLSWWAAVIGGAVLGALGVERLVRGLAPLRMLLRGSLLFPGKPPPRISIAARQSSKEQLLDRLDKALESDRGAADTQAMTRILTLIAQLQAHDRKTRGHAERVRMVTDLMTAERGLPEADRDRIRWAALLHDIGKIDIDPAVLTKREKLTDEEWHAIRRHPELGMKRCAPLLGWLGRHAGGISEHHERFDGTGYPNGVAGTDIAEAARIIAVVDAFEVMTSKRPYRTPISIPAAKQELLDSAGSQFDPSMVKSFLQLSTRSLSKAVGLTAGLGAAATLRPSPNTAGVVTSVGLLGVLALSGVIAPVEATNVEQSSGADPAEVVVDDPAADQASDGGSGGGGGAGSSGAGGSGGDGAGADGQGDDGAIDGDAADGDAGDDGGATGDNASPDDDEDAAASEPATSGDGGSALAPGGNGNSSGTAGSGGGSGSAGAPGSGTGAGPGSGGGNGSTDGGAPGDGDPSTTEPPGQGAPTDPPATSPVGPPGTPSAPPVLATPPGVVPPGGPSGAPSGPTPVAPPPDPPPSTDPPPPDPPPVTSAPPPDPPPVTSAPPPDPPPVTSAPPPDPPPPTEPPPSPPVAVDDRYSAPLSGAMGALPVLENDSDPDGDLDPSSVTVVNQPTNGAATPVADGRIQVAMNAGFTGQDQLVYRVCDLEGLCSQATVFLTIGRR